MTSTSEFFILQFPVIPVCFSTQFSCTTHPHRSHPGADYVGFYKFGDPAILIRSLSLVKSVLLDNFKSFQANDVHLEKDLDPLLSMNPFFVRGDEWKHKRAQVTPILTAAKIRMAFPLVRDICQRFVEYIERGSQKGEDFEARTVGYPQ